METPSTGRIPRWALLTLTLTTTALLAALLGACGGDSSETTSGQAVEGTESTGAEALSGSPVKVMTVAPLTAPGGSSIVAPEVGKAAEATVEFINAHGGVNGRPLEVIVCDEKGEPAQDTACARKATAEDVVSYVGTYSLNGEKAYPFLEQSEIANLGNISLSPSDGTSPISFVLNGGSSVLPALGQIAAEHPDCDKTGLVQFEGPSIEKTVAGVGGALEAEGEELAYDIHIPPTVTDYTPFAAEVAQKGDCVILVITDQASEAFIPALRQLSDQPIVAFPLALTPDLVAKLGPAVEGTRGPQYFPLYDSDKMAEYRKIMDEYSDVSSYNPASFLAVNTYLSMRVFAEVAAELDEVTAPNFLKALGEAKRVDGFGLTPPLNLTSESEWTQVPFLARILNRNLIYSTVEDGAFAPLGSERFHDLSKLGAEAFAGSAE